MLSPPGRGRNAAGGPEGGTYLQSEPRQDSIQILHELNPVSLAGSSNSRMDPLGSCPLGRVVAMSRNESTLGPDGTQKEWSGVSRPSDSLPEFTGDKPV